MGACGLLDPVRRLFAWLVGLAVLVAAMVYAGGGWYFSGQIEEGGLAVRHHSPDRSLEVVRVARGAVTLLETGSDVPALDDDSTYGLGWDGGYGQIFGPVKRDRRGAEDGAVTRQLKVLKGNPPRTGDMAGLERDAFPADAPVFAVGERLRNVNYPSGGGTYPAWFVPGRGNSWVILTHGGLGTTRAEALRAMTTTVDLAMPSLAIGYRNDEGVAGGLSGHYAYGQTVWRELEGAVQYALNHGARNIVLVGYSMGAAIAASFLQQSPLASRVSRVVFDAPMLDFAATVDYGAAQRTLPVIGHVPPSLTWTAKQFARARFGVDWGKIDYLEDSGWLTVPALVFHGAEDTKVPLSTSEELAQDHPDLVTLVTVRDAGHVEAWNESPKAYDKELREFVARK